MNESNNQSTDSGSESDNECRVSRQRSVNRDRLNSILDPSYAPKILRKNKSISRAESSGSLVNESKVLVLYTGGTIGMMRSSKGGLAPTLSHFSSTLNESLFTVYTPRANALEAELRRYPQLHDNQYASKHFRLPEPKSPLVLP